MEKYCGVEKQRSYWVIEIKSRDCDLRIWLVVRELGQVWLIYDMCGDDIRPLALLPPPSTYLDRGKETSHLRRDFAKRQH